MRTAILLAALMLSTAPVGAQPPGRAQAPPAILYRCHSHTNLGETQTTLTIDKSFREDGSVADMSVTWQGNAETLHRIPNGHFALVTMHWPGDVYTTEPGPLNWSRGTISIHVYGEATNRRRQPLRGELWRQYLLDRDQSIRVREQSGVPSIVDYDLRTRLVSDLLSFSSPGNLLVSLDGFLAWGAGVERLTVYETVVTYRPPRRNSYPNSPIGRRRVVSDFDVDVAAIARTAEQIRAATRAWEAGMGDFRAVCVRGVEDSEQIVVT